MRTEYRLEICSEERSMESRCSPSGAPPPGEAQLGCVPQHLRLQLAATSLPGEQRGSTKAGLGRWQETGCVSAVPFHTLFSVSPSTSFAFERAVPVKKKAPAHESKCQGQRASLTEPHQRQRTILILRNNKGFLASAVKIRCLKWLTCI